MVKDPHEPAPGSGAPDFTAQWTPQPAGEDRFVAAGTEEDQLACHFGENVEAVRRGSGAAVSLMVMYQCAVMRRVVAP
jgi:hypothetical protein